jgi:hypothetical protein
MHHDFSCFVEAYTMAPNTEPPRPRTCDGYIKPTEPLTIEVVRREANAAVYVALCRIGVVVFLLAFALLMMGVVYEAGKTQALIESTERLLGDRK